MGSKKTIKAVTANKRALKRAVLITTSYAAFGISWVVITDVLFALRYPQGAETYYTGIFKGIIFVIITALLIFLLAFNGFRKELKNAIGKEKSEAALRQAQRLAHIGSYRYDCASCHVEYSSEAQRILGFDGDAAAGSPEEAFRLVRAEDAASVKATIQAAVAEHMSAELTCWIIDKNGNERYVKVHFQPYYGDDDSFFYANGTIQDVTKQKLAEQDAMVSQSIYQAFIGSCCDFFYMKDERLRYLVMNRRMAEYYGLHSEEEAFGKVTSDIISDETAETWHERDAMVRDSGKSMRVEEAVNGETFESIIFPVQLTEGRVGVGGITRNITQRHLTETALAKERDRAEMYLDISGIIFIALDLDGRVTMINRFGCSILGLNKEDVIGEDWVERFIAAGYKHSVRDIIERLGKDEYNGYISLENPIVASGGETRIIEWNNAILYDETGAVSGVLAAGLDITELKLAMRALRESERSKSVLLANLQGVAYRCSFDRKWTMQFVSQGCFALTGYQPEELLGNAKVSFDDIICEEYREYIWQESVRATSEKRSCRYEYEICTAEGERKWVLEINQGVYDEKSELQALEGIIIDITESKKQFLQIQYLSDHDALTGLYNRQYYETAKAALDRKGEYPFTILLADINGLKLINDAFGHDAGDRMIKKTAGILMECKRAQDTLSRIGGDEFALLMPNASMADAYRMIESIKEAFSAYNASLTDKAKVISLSIGSSTKTCADIDVTKVEYDADANMSIRKLLDLKSHHNAVLSSITATMYERSYETESHAERISQICEAIGRRVGLLSKEIDKLRLFGTLHDIGKIGISDQILKKPGKLTEEEWKEMRKHPEIGYRIAMASPDFAHIADCILTHHERWDGSGYPNGLSGEEIPLLSRILAIVDAYDAMTQDRVYRKAIPREAALDEIKRSAGTQFDPSVVTEFLLEMQN
jgi:diguanylate cyclase (GGDEF)-like protein/PAS domain S-box-containing protein